MAQQPVQPGSALAGAVCCRTAPKPREDARLPLSSTTRFRSSGIHWRTAPITVGDSVPILAFLHDNFTPDGLQTCRIEDFSLCAAAELSLALPPMWISRSQGRFPLLILPGRRLPMTIQTRTPTFCFQAGREASGGRRMTGSSRPRHVRRPNFSESDFELTSATCVYGRPSISFQ